MLPDINPTLGKELDLNMDTEDKDKEDIASAYLSSYKDEVTKLKRRLYNLSKWYNKFLNTAKFNLEVAKNKIKDLKVKIAYITSLAEGLSKEAEKSQNLYREYIKHTAALATNRKDLGKIL